MPLLKHSGCKSCHTASTVRITESMSSEWLAPSRALEERRARWAGTELPGCPGGASLWSADWDSREKCPFCPPLILSVLRWEHTQISDAQWGRRGPAAEALTALGFPLVCCSCLHSRAGLLHPVFTPECVFITVRTRRTSLSRSYKGN